MKWITYILDRKNLIIILLGVLLFFSLRSNVEQQIQRQDLIETLSQRDSIFNEKVTDLGRTIEASVKQYEASDVEILSKVDGMYVDLKNRLAMSSRDIKQLQSSTGFAVVVRDTIESEPIIIIDSTKVDNQLFGDYFYEDETISIKTGVQPDRLIQEYTLKPNTYTVDILDESRWYQKTKLRTYITSENPKYKFTDTNIFVKNSPKPRATLALGLGASVGTDFKVRPAISFIFGIPIKVFYW